MKKAWKGLAVKGTIFWIVLKLIKKDNNWLLLHPLTLTLLSLEFYLEILKIENKNNTNKSENNIANISILCVQTFAVWMCGMNMFFNYKKLLQMWMWTDTNVKDNMFVHRTKLDAREFNSHFSRFCIIKLKYHNHRFLV